MVIRDKQGIPLYATAFIAVSRADRDTGDGVRYMKLDNPMIMTRDEKIMAEIDTWQSNDTVHVKGVLACKKIRKVSRCAFCNAKNVVDGTLVYVNPIYARKLGHVDSEAEMMKFLTDNREISNQAYIFGTLCRDPKKIKNSKGMRVVQYQIAMNRKFKIKEDPPEIKADYPWVKCYGANAEEDKKHLKIGSEIFVDGLLQTRSVQRKAVCGQVTGDDGEPVRGEDGKLLIRKNPDGTKDGCGATYNWKDRATEIVPYDTEYLNGYLTDEDILEIEENKARQAIESFNEKKD